MTEKSNNNETDVVFATLPQECYSPFSLEERVEQLEKQVSRLFDLLTDLGHWPPL